MRDAAVSAVRGLLTGNQQQADEARNRAADALARAQNIPVDQARTQIQQYEQQYRQAVDQAKQQATEAADVAAKAVSRAALLAALALLLARYDTLALSERFAAALAGFFVASVALYVTVLILSNRQRRQLVSEGRLPASSVRLPL